jgi:hypothetical protein
LRKNETGVDIIGLIGLDAGFIRKDVYMTIILASLLTTIAATRILGSFWATLILDRPCPRL